MVDGLEVLALSYLRKGEPIIVGMDNSSIKLEVVSGSETFSILGQEACLFQTYLLLFNEGVVSDKQSIVSLKTNNAKGLVVIKETRVVSRLFYKQFVDIVRIVRLKLIVSGLQNAIKRLDHLKNGVAFEV